MEISAWASHLLGGAYCAQAEAAHTLPQLFFPK